MNNMPHRPEPLYAQFSELKSLIKWLEDNNIDCEEQKFFFPDMLSVKVFTGQLNRFGRRDAVTFMQIKANGGVDGPVLCRLPGEEDAKETSISEAKVLSQQFAGKLPLPSEYRDALYEKALDDNISLTSAVMREITILLNSCIRRIGMSQGSLTKPVVLAEDGGYALLFDPVAKTLLGKSPEGTGPLGPNSPEGCFSLFPRARENLEKARMDYVRNSKKKVPTETLEENNRRLSSLIAMTMTGKAPGPRKETDKNTQLYLSFSVANGSSGKPARSKAAAGRNPSQNKASRGL